MSTHNKQGIYQVSRLIEPIPINADWDKAPWQTVEPLLISHYMGDEPDHKPVTQAKIAYDTDNLYCIFRVQDNFIRAVTSTSGGPVWEDSCVEFFFRPNTTGYFNLETNCIGTPLLRYQVAPNREITPLPTQHYNRIQIAHSLPAKLINPEISTPLVWTLEYCLPIDLLNHYLPVSVLSSGTQWSANFYKCGDKTSHPHWLTWSPINNPTPDFHRPDYFGILEFE